ncbi:MAG: beta-L-arabinofuranosidase domain-containing protein [Verrucomicrobiota bacterium]
MNVRCIQVALLALGFIASAADAPMGVERIARFTPHGYVFKSVGSNDAVHWLQVDLGRSVKIDTVKLLPLLNGYGTDAPGFPVRFKLEAAGEPDFKTSVLIADRTGGDVPSPGDVVGIYPASGISGRYVRLTVTRLRKGKLELSKMEVWSGGRDAAEGRPVADFAKGNLGVTMLTRHPRPQGEGVVTDNPGNIIPASRWKPVADQVQRPLRSVHLDGGVFETAMRNNIDYLLKAYTVDEMLREFRTRAGKPNPPDLRKPDKFWEDALAGSCAGRFLMGAGNTLRWLDNAELRQRMNLLVDGIADCRQPNGYIMAYPEDTIFTSERAAYTRAWLTHGLIEAGYAGNPKAFPLLRGYYDWFDKNPYSPELLRRAGQGVQGMIANARMYFTPVGQPEDLQVIQRYFQENYWLKQLAGREPEAIWKYPYDHPHNYLITSLEPYLDLYRATGNKLYLQASLGGWELYHDYWEHVGGSIAICEEDAYPPKSYLLHKHTGELCGSVFWVRYNQRFHLLYPAAEKYVNEIEKSIYNVGLANQVGTNGIFYHANLVGKKDFKRKICINSCCEGQGTRLYGSLPEYIYTLAEDGLLIDLFAPSTIDWQIKGQALQLKMETAFPLQPDVRLSLNVSSPTKAKLRLRVPVWAAAKMPILVNGTKVATGKPGSYAVLDRTWSDGDTVTFSLPMTFKLTHYDGAERVAGQERYSLEYGPILLALIGSVDEKLGATLASSPENLVKQLTPKPGQPLHFTIAGDADHEYLPYWQVTDQVFTCYPVLSRK